MTITTLQYDVVVVGSGASGSTAAETAARDGARVLVISKDPIACSDTKISEGIMTVRGSASAKDSAQSLTGNMLTQGDDLGDSALVAAFSRDSGTSYDWLLNQGIAARLNPETGKPQAMTMPLGGHNFPRSVDHVNGGLDFGHACWNALTNGSLDYLEDAWFVDLYLRDKRITGGLVYLASEGRFVSIRAGAVILACGGLSTLYFPNTDTMRGNTGDAYGIAARAGAQLVDMEQVQFIPFAIARPSTYQGLIVGEPAIAGALGVLRDASGKVIAGELSGRTRAECCAVIVKAVAQGRGTENQGCYLDLTENRKGKSGECYSALIKDKAPGLLKTVKAALGPAAARFEEPWEIRPSAHYLMGGIRTTDNGEVIGEQGQLIKGLFAVGQAMGGLHGSNRLGSTSLAEGIVFGQRAGRCAAHYVANTQPLSETISLDHDEQQAMAMFARNPSTEGGAVLRVIRELQAAAWQGIGPGRSESGMAQTLATVEKLERRLKRMAVSTDGVWNQSLIDYLECRNLLLCAAMITRSAMARTGSLGAHVRLDAPRGHKQESHCSVVCCIDDQGKGQLQITALPRKRSALLQRALANARSGLRIAVTRLIKKLPFSWRDRILLKVYRKALGETEVSP